MGVFLFIYVLIITYLSRFLIIMICSLILNKYRVKNKITKNFKIVIWFVGFKGTMAFALCVKSSE